MKYFFASLSVAAAIIYLIRGQNIIASFIIAWILFNFIKGLWIGWKKGRK